MVAQLVSRRRYFLRKCYVPQGQGYMCANCRVDLVRTRCQILCSMRLQCVSKILTPCRMLKKSSLIAKINGWNNSFQNMYDMLQVKVDRFARKTFSYKKNSLFWQTRFWGSWLLEELYAVLLALGQLIGCPWKVWGMTVQTSYWEGLRHQNCGYTSLILFFL